MWEIVFVVATQFAIKKKLKDLIYMIFLGVPCHKLYKECVFYYGLPLKYMCHLGRLQKNLTLEAKNEIK
jgi:hypothetical protein